MTWLLISNVAAWIVILALLMVVLALARQIGVLHERIAPVGALSLKGGPEVGEPAPGLTLVTLDGRSLAIGQPTPVMRMLLFVSPDCAVCKRLIPLALSVAKSEEFDLIFASDGDDAALASMAAHYGIAHLPFVNSQELGLAFQVAKLPYAVLLDEAGRVGAKGLVNTREHLESLVTAKQTGFPSIQAWLARGRPETETV
ncbi:MAG TPA: methylamine dehydrogenase [Caulobacteraceae bacterium]|nr:methylamine dehydrogenase [Caulobacteraceae bacterium]